MTDRTKWVAAMAFALLIGAVLILAILLGKTNHKIDEQSQPEPSPSATSDVIQPVDTNGPQTWAKYGAPGGPEFWIYCLQTHAYIVNGDDVTRDYDSDIQFCGAPDPSLEYEMNRGTTP